MKSYIGKDMTEGSMLKNVFSFSVPMLFGNILQALYSTIDSIIVGRFLGHKSLAAISVSFPIIFLLITFVAGISMATTILVAQYWGAKDKKMISRVLNNSLLLLITTGVFASFLGIIFSNSMLKLINTPNDILYEASSYLKIYLSGLVFVFGYNVVSATFRGLGDSKTPLKFLGISIIINLILDPIFILGFGLIPRMGVNGAALATIISQMISLIAALIYLHNKSDLVSFKKENLKLDKEITLKTLKLGLPTAIQQSVISLGSIIIGSIINGFGTAVVAAYGIVNKLDKYAIMPAMSFSLGTASITGQNIGAKKEDNVKYVVRGASILTFIIAFTLMLIALIFPRGLISLFTSDYNVIALGKIYLRIIAFSYIPFSLGFVTNGALKGAGKVISPMIISIISLWGIRIPLAKMFSISIGPEGVYIAIVISSIATMIMSRLYYSIGVWKDSFNNKNRILIQKTNS